MPPVRGVISSPLEPVTSHRPLGSGAGRHVGRTIDSGELRCTVATFPASKEWQDSTTRGSTNPAVWAPLAGALPAGCLGVGGVGFVPPYRIHRAAAAPSTSAREHPREHTKRTTGVQVSPLSAPRVAVPRTTQRPPQADDTCHRLGRGRRLPMPSAQLRVDPPWLT